MMIVAACSCGPAFGQTLKRSDATGKRSAEAATQLRGSHDRDSHVRRARRHPRRFDGRPRFYWDGSGHRFGSPAVDSDRDEALEEAYRQGVEDGRALERFEIQAERGFGAFEQAMQAGQIAFETGDYGLSARQLRLACSLNQGDPVARIAAAHAHAAVQDYDSAAGLLRRAFELQPRFAYLPLAIRDAYGQAEDFTRHLHALARAAELTKDNGDRWFLLGYYYYYSDNMAGATNAFEQAVKLAPTDVLSAQLLDLARLSAPKE